MSGGKGPTILRRCDCCGTEYHASIARLKRNWDRCCSFSCANTLRARLQGARRHSKHPYQRQNSQSKFKQEVRLKAGYCCQICGISESETGRSLDVHRIKPDDQGGNYIDGNVIALCRSCHIKIER